MEGIDASILVFLSMIYEVFKVLFYVLGVLCFLKYLESDRQPRPRCCGTGNLLSPLWSPLLNSAPALRSTPGGFFVAVRGKLWYRRGRKQVSVFYAV